MAPIGTAQHRADKACACIVHRQSARFEHMNASKGKAGAIRNSSQDLRRIAALAAA